MTPDVCDRVRLRFWEESSPLDFLPPRLLRDHQKEDGRGPAEDRPVRRHHARALLEVSGHVLHYLGRVRGGGEVRKISEGQRYVRQRVVHGRYRREDGREEPRPCEALDDVAREGSEHEAYGYRRHEDEEERRGQLEGLDRARVDVDLPEGRQHHQRRGYVDYLRDRHPEHVDR